MNRNDKLDKKIEDSQYLICLLNELKSGKTIQEIALREEKEPKYFMSESTLKRFLKNNGYQYDKKQKLWYSQKQKNEIFMMNNCDIEEEIEEISKKRYYDRYANPYPDGIAEEEKEELKLHKGMFKELEEIGKEFGCDYTEELIELILLRFLEKYRKKDLTLIFRREFLLKDGFDEKEVEILMKYSDDSISAPANELLWELESEEGNELMEFYKRELINNDIVIEGYEDFKSLKENYDNMKRRGINEGRADKRQSKD